MSIRVVTVALLACTGLLAAGCVQTVETTFDDALVEQVGDGSVAVKRIDALMEDASKASRLSDPDVDQLMTHLIEGRLDRLDRDDITTLREVNRDSRGRFSGTLADVDELAANIRAHLVDSDAHTDLSGGASKFIIAWNAYLDENASMLRQMSTSVTEMEFSFRGFDRLMDAAVQTAELGHTRRFDRVRDEYMADLTGAAEQFQQTMDGFVESSATDKLLALVNDDQEARAIFEEVRDRYPNGSVADFTRDGE